MDDDETPVSRPRSPKAEPMVAPSDGELSRMAREAVRQPADPRLDRQLALMGLTEPPEPAGPHPGQPTGPSIPSGAELGALDSRLRRMETILVALVVAVGILALTVVILLFR